MRWSEKNTLNFLKIYLAKECLWNPSHDMYRIKYKRNLAYSEIVSEFKTITGKCMTTPEVKIKIKNLRSTYTQEVQKIIQKSSPDSIYQPSLIWFHDMDRCLKYLSNSKTSAADSKSQEMHNEEDSDQAGCASQDGKYTGNIEKQPDSFVPMLFLSDHEHETVTEPCISVVQVKKELVSSPEYSNLYIKRKRKKRKIPQYCIQSQVENWAKEDEFDLYGKYIASQLRKLQLQKALKVQFEIQNLMNEARGSASGD